MNPNRLEERRCQQLEDRFTGKRSYEYSQKVVLRFVDLHWIVEYDVLEISRPNERSQNLRPSGVHRMVESDLAPKQSSCGPYTVAEPGSQGSSGSPRDCGEWNLFPPDTGSHANLQKRGRVFIEARGDRDVKEDVVNGDSKGIELKAITYKDPEKGDLEKGADINLFEKADFEKAIELTGK
uniref:Uncharacterized protein n=1 Tax=Timema genevievae TaxID=629358 RepID=A0A7R9K4I1_TIMGE|nr:unnamed protein product [Timema genevievae]